MQIQNILGDRAAQDELRRSTAGPHCNLLTVDPSFCRECELNPQHRRAADSSLVEVEELQPEIHDTVSRMALLDAGVPITLREMTELEALMLTIGHSVRRQIENEKAQATTSTAEGRERYRRIQERAIREGRDA